jgi:broad specificity phosphatase PhoE
VCFTGRVLYLVRHGRTSANANGLLQGRIDLPLDTIGHEQAEAIAALIGPVDTVIASPLDRAMQTAEWFGRPIEVDERWIELAYGEYEGMAVGDVPADVWEAWRCDVDFRSAGGESFAELDSRVRSACDELRPRIADERIVVVSHVSPIKAGVAWALDAPLRIMFHCHLAQASVCRISIGRFGPVLETFNEQALPALTG